MAQTYDDLLVWAYVGEVWGQHMLERLLEDDTFSSERDDLLLLLALETRTRQALEALISSRGLVVELAPAHQEAEDYAQRLAQEQDWEAFMRETHGIATSALPDFERLRDLAPASEVEPPGGDRRARAGGPQLLVVQARGSAGPSGYGGLRPSR